MDYLDSSKRVTLADIIESEDSPKMPLAVENLYEYTVRAPEQEHAEVAYNIGEMTTVIDRVYDYINNKGMTSINDLSDHLGIKKHQVEKMVEILEISQLIKVKYSVVPNGKVEILVVKRESNDKPREIPHEERIKGLKKVIMGDIDRLENAVSSMEHHLRTWAFEAEEKASKPGGMRAETITKINQESIHIEKNLGEAGTIFGARIESLKKRLSEMRMNINSPSEGKSGGSTAKQGWAQSRLLNIKNLFNF